MADTAPKPSVLTLFIAVLLIPAVLGSSTTIFNDGDTSWHIATGRWILDHAAIPHTDPFSYTAAGKPWTPMEWLADVIYALAHSFAGYAGVSAVVTAALIALHAIIYFNARHSIGPIAATCALVALDVVLIPMMLARPHVLTWPLAALWVLLLMRAREAERAPPLWSAAVITLWTNLHASFVVGLLIAGAFGVEALVTSNERARVFREWATFGLACLVAFCINPHGIHALLYPLGFTNLQMLPLIDEWKPSSTRVTPLFFVVLAATTGLVAWKRLQLHWVRWLLLGSLLGLALLQTRHQAMFAIVAAMILPQGLASAAKNAPTEPRSALLVALAGALLLVGARVAMPLTPPDNETNPWKLIASIPSQLRSQPVLNGYSMGGPLILSGIRPYIDGRSDMYGDELVLGFKRITNGDANELSAATRRWNIRWAIVPNNGGLMALLDRSPGWRRIRQDKVGAIYVRETSGARGGI